MGPYRKTLKKSESKLITFRYEWPDERCLVYFNKQGSELWKKKLENYIDIDDLTFNQVWSKAFQKLQCMGVITNYIENTNEQFPIIM